ncbi:MAG: protein kinase [Bradymonadaceae bacterium]|nr:protein kinase [Lujinxingiaceae bacterium]
MSSPLPSAGTVLGGRYRLISDVEADLGLKPALAIDAQTNTSVGITFLPSPNGQESADQTAKHFQSFQREIRRLLKLSAPQALAIHGHGQLEGSGRYLVFEWVEAASTAQIIAEQAPIEIGRVVDIWRQALAGLEHAHAANIIHGELEPADVLVIDDGDEVKVKLKHFQLSALVGSALSTSGRDRRYCSPEQQSGERASPQSDLYSLGLVVVGMLAGEQSGDQAPGARVAGLDIEPGLRALLAACLSPDPSRRPSTAAEALRLLEQVALPSSPPKPAGAVSQEGDDFGSSSDRLELSGPLDFEEDAFGSADALADDEPMQLEGALDFAADESIDKPEGQPRPSPYASVQTEPKASPTVEQSEAPGPPAATPAAKPGSQVQGLPKITIILGALVVILSLVAILSVVKSRMDNRVASENLEAALEAVIPLPELVNVTIRTRPPALRVWINDRSIGLSPVKLELRVDEFPAKVRARLDSNIELTLDVAEPLEEIMLDFSEHMKN